jgi:hypothetical protein
VVPPRAVKHKASWLARFAEYQRFREQGCDPDEIAGIMRQSRRTIERYAREARALSTKYNTPGHGSNPDEPLAYAATEGEQCELAYQIAAWADGPQDALVLADVLAIPMRAFGAAAASLALRRKLEREEHRAGSRSGLGAGRSGGAGQVPPGDAGAAAGVRRGAGHANGDARLQRRRTAGQEEDG